MKKLACLLLIALPVCSLAATYTVDDDGPADFDSIQLAIDSTSYGDEIIVLPGLYRENINFNGNSRIVRSTNPDDPNVVDATIISGSFSGSAVTFNGYESSSCQLCGFTITYGRSENGGGIDGGDEYHQTNAVIKNCTIHFNESYEGHGGGIAFCEGTISNCIITDNSAYWPGFRAYGGGLYKCNAKIENCIISDNTATMMGGGLYECHGTITNCIISDNSAGWNGGGFFNCDGTITNCVISGNYAYEFAGGMYHCSGTISNCTVVNNSTSTGGTYRKGGGLYKCSGNINSCIVWGNYAAIGSQVHECATPTYSCIQGWTQGGTGNISDIPIFLSDGYHISDNSPCIDVGDPNKSFILHETDIDGDPRIISRVDMGADEVFDDSYSYIWLSDDELNFKGYGINSSVPSQTLTIQKYGPMDLHWQIQVPNEPNWLTVFPLSGHTTNYNSDVNISAEPNEAGYGTHSCELIVSDPNAINNPQTVNITFIVYGPSLSTYPSQLNFYAEKDASGPLDGTFNITNSGYDILDWHLEIPNEPNWIQSVYPSNGQCERHEANQVTLIIEPNGLDEGDYQATFEIFALDVSYTRTVTVNLNIYTPNDIHVPIDYNTITEAQYAASYGDRIIVHPGRYTGGEIPAKGLTIKSIDPQNQNVINATVIESPLYIYSYDPTTEGLIIDGLSFVYNPDIYQNPYASGIVNNCRQLTVCNCVVKNWPNSGIRCGIYRAGSFSIENCLISHNYASGISLDTRKNSFTGLIKNCTIAETMPNQDGIKHGISCSAYNPMWLSIINSVFSNSVSPNDIEIYIESVYSSTSGDLIINHCCMPGGPNGISAPNDVNVTYGPGNIDVDPCFVARGYWDPNGTPGDANDDFWVDGDYHLKSEGWRWDSIRQRWDWDDVTSRCIDAGNPGSLLDNEPLTIPEDPNNEWGHNLRINMGAYGGTAEASIPPHDWALLCDVTNDGTTNLADFTHLADMFMQTDDELFADFNRDGKVDLHDLALFIADWLHITTWH